MAAKSDSVISNSNSPLLHAQQILGSPEWLVRPSSQHRTLHQQTTSTALDNSSFEPADFRLLTNLLKQEKDYSNSLNSTLDQCQTSLNALEAYAAASTPPTSNVIVSVAGYINNAEASLRKYATAIDGWRVRLEGLRELEDEVANVMRDREILVGRLIKASKSKQSQRDSSPPPAANTFSRPHNSKLGDAQAELQACEAHLASKERELDSARINVLREGLQMRCRAMIECGWTWGEMGKEACSALDALAAAHTNGHSLTYPLLKPLPRPKSPDVNGSDSSSIPPSHSASQLALPNSYMDPPFHVRPLVSRLHIDPPHSVSDHEIPIRRDIPSGPPSSGSSDDNEDQLEVHDNPIFTNRRLTRSGTLRFSSQGSRSELGTQTTTPWRHRDKKLKDSSFMGGIAALFKIRRARGAESSDEEDPPPIINYSRLQKQKFRARPTEPNVPTPKKAPRRRTASLGVPTSSTNENLVLMKPMPVSDSPRGKSADSTKDISSLSQIESGSNAGPSSPRKAASHINNSRSSLEVIAKGSAQDDSEVKRLGTTKSTSDRSSHSAKTRSWDGIPASRSMRSNLVFGQPSLFTVMENGSRSQGRSGRENNRRASLPPAILKPVTAPGSVFDRLNSPFLVEEQAPSFPSTSQSRSSDRGDISNFAAGSTPVTSPTITATSLQSGNSPRMNTVPLRSALRVRSPSPASSPEKVSSTPPVSTLKASRASAHPPSSWTVPTDEDSASLASAYETGQESLSEDDSPPKEPAPPSKTQQQARPTPATTTPMHSGEDTISVGSNSTATGEPTRRKSVRMSLQPTFSATPPALEDEPKSPWAPPPGRSKHLRTSSKELDPWQDSSGESDDYSRARKALSRAAQRMKNVAKTPI